MGVATFDPSADNTDVRLMSNPWIEVDGTPVNWRTSTLPRIDCPCGEGFRVIIPGVIDNMDTDEGVQRCDACDTYSGDLEAATALATFVGGIVRYETQEG